MGRIFDLFYQAEGPGQGRAGGLGIGLTLVKRLVELHGGRVGAQSEGRGGGAMFTVMLPAVAPGASHEAPPLGAADARTVLVDEGNPDALESLRLVLELRGHRVFKAGDASEALRVLKAGRPAVAIIDSGLPRMDGYGLAREIRSQYDG